MKKKIKKVYIQWRAAGEFRNRWWKRPLCWLVKHKKTTISPYGCYVHQCSRCGKVFWRKKRNGEDSERLFNGEIGMLYGVRFVETINHEH
jgi:hypothetical protein